jgi:L-amino acid N-acyltransferase YncA
MRMLQILPATLDHLPEITAIFSHHILNGTGSFHLSPPSLEEMKEKWIELQNLNHPWLVALEQSSQKVLGFCYASDFRKKEAFKHTLEDTIYIHPDERQRGIGKALLGALVDQCRALGYAQLVAVIGDSKNTGSIALHESLGFEHRGVLTGVGLKKGQWLDVVFMQLSLSAQAPSSPPP